MYKRFFDKIALSYLLIIMVVFVVIIVYASNATRENLIEERQTTLTNETQYIAEQFVLPYQQNQLTAKEIQEEFNTFQDNFNIRIWYCDTNGNLLFVSNPSDYESLPENLYALDASNALTNSFFKQGDFYAIFSEQMLSVGMPVSGKNFHEAGSIILHAPFSPLSDIMQSMMLNFTVPLCVLIIMAMMLLLYLAKKILDPLNQLNQAAKEYASGNFDIKTGITSQDEIGELASNMEYMASELSKLDEYRSDFIANISHDFRSPLTSIKGYIQAMLDGTIPPENQEKYLNIVLSETQRLTKLTASMLELSKSDSYGLHLNLINFDITEVVDATIDFFERECQKRYIIIRKNCQTENTFVRADKTRIQQVLYNLVDNAMKFSPHGATITIIITDANDKVFVSVKDTGQGIDKDKQSKVWNRFYKADTSRGKHKQGSGLGLSIIREIIHAHDENITLTSTPGIGSEFTFSLKKAPDTYHS